VVGAAGGGSAGGSSGSVGAAGSGAAAPVLSRLALRPSSFATHRLRPSRGRTQGRAPGTTVRYRASQAALTTFVVRRLLAGQRIGRGPCKPLAARAKLRKGARRCTVLRRIGSFKHRAKAGVNSLRFTGRLAGRALPAGRYLLTATPSAGGLAGKTVTTRFRVQS
jgi:hypothetical protein